MAGFDLSRRARDDLVGIGLFGAERWGDERSERYMSDLYGVFQRLVSFRRKATGLLVCRVLHRRQLPELHPIDDHG